MKRILTLALLLLVVCLAASAQSSSRPSKSLRKLFRYMAGEFDSEDQSKADSAFFHIKLRMKPIWKERTDGYWLYVEQASASAEAQPYRQRIYHLYQQDKKTLVSKVYEMNNPMQYAGAWRDESLLQNLRVESLIDRQGCSIYLQAAKGGSFRGSTPGKECLSTLRGAAYASSEVEIYPDRLLSWDRGWDKNDQQVWGAVKGGYVFVKRKGFWGSGKSEIGKMK